MTQVENATQVSQEGPGGVTPASPSLRDRLIPPTPGNPWLSWLGPLLIAAFATALRLDRLHIPGKIVFDETYYVKDAYGLLNFGVEHSTVENADRLVTQGSTNIWTDSGSFVVHPPAGKWLIAIGEWLFGLTPFGWRFAAAVIGGLSVLLIARIARRMTRSTLLGCVAGLLLALDGLHFVQSRVALLDIFVMFWGLAAFGCLVIDRDRARARLAERVDGSGPLGPWLGLRPWRIAAGVCLGLAVATKWSGVYFIAAFALLTVGWDIWARRSAGVRRWFGGSLLRDLLPGLLALLVIPLVYLASWTGWFVTDIGWGRDWASNQPSAWGFVPEALRSLWHYHWQIWNFHVHLDKQHDYQSLPWEWLVLARPVAYFYTSPTEGQLGCAADTCSRAILAIGTPVIWWASLFALLAMIWLAISRVDWRAIAILVSIAFGWLPWFWYALDERTMFFFYALPILPFLILAITLSLGMIIGPGGRSSRRRIVGSAVAGGYMLLVIANLWYLYPILAAKTIPYQEWLSRMWFDSWI
ncbi:MAG: phospholipid carrier-dependent glycosyltransferase [Streptosporangiales bacterium]|nr:phospholipid carrier-dependent glycosyltransferase [Streptosporangiales bacterium]